jgi:hypothetical protein
MGQRGKRKGFPDRVLFEDAGWCREEIADTDPEAYDYVLKESSRPRR